MTDFRRLLVLSALCAAPAVAATGFEDLGQLEARVTATLGAGIGETGGPARPIDRRLKLAACPTSPSLAVPTPYAAMIQCEALGWRIHVPLVRPSAAMASAEKREMIVRKGDQVELIADGGNFTVSTLAIAQQDGALGDRIRVRSGDKAAPVTAEVERQGRVILSRFN